MAAPASSPLSAQLRRRWSDLGLRRKGLIVALIPVAPLMTMVVLGYAGGSGPHLWWLALTLVGGAIGLAVIVWCTAALSGRIARVEDNARRLADGRALIRLPESNDEIGRLARALQDAEALLASRDRAVREASDDVDRFFSVSPDLLCIASFDGYFLRLNASWTKTLGWSIDELRSRPYVEFIHPDDRGVTDREAKQLSAGAVTLNFKNRYRTRDGSYRWLEWNAYPVVERGAIYAAARDITEHQAAAHSLQQAQLEAERANRAKNDFLSRMSHDLRTPLNAVLGFAQLLETEPLPPEQRDGVKQILSGGRLLLDLINEILDLARIESGRLALSPEPVAIDEIVREAVDLVRPLAADRRVAVTVDARTADDLYVLADRRRMRQVLLNLLSNAVKYNRDHGRVTVSWSTQGADRCRIHVTDTGLGIRREKLVLLFQPFERLGAEQTVVEGTGLGLVVAKGLIEAMGGSIGVDTEIDRGSTFWIDLAQADAPGRHLAPAAIPQGLDAESELDGTVLYIEDNPSNVQLMERIIARLPRVRLLSAPDAEAGLRLAVSSHPDLVLLDLHLPGVGGEEVLRRLWANPLTRAIPVAVVSADATHSQIRRLLADGACAYLTKPLDVARVIELVGEKVGGTRKSM